MNKTLLSVMMVLCALVMLGGSKAEAGVAFNVSVGHPAGMYVSVGSPGYRVCPPPPRFYHGCYHRHHHPRYHRHHGCRAPRRHYHHRAHHAPRRGRGHR